jgi:hypothetical protein
VQGGVHTKAVYVLYCMYYFLYGGRGIVFAMVRCRSEDTADSSLASLSTPVCERFVPIHGVL